MITNVTDSKGAAVFAGLFWVFKAIFVFVFTFAPGNASKKLKILILAMIGSGIISLLIVLAGERELACYVSSFLFGMGTSSMYPLILSFAVE